MEPQERLIVVAGLVWLGPDRVLLQRRSSTAKHGAGRLEFVGGKIEPGEAPRTALSRELIEEWGPAAGALAVGPVAEVLHHVYSPPAPEVLLLLYHVSARGWGDAWPSRIDTEPGATVEAYTVADIPLNDLLAADRPFAEALAAGRVGPPRAFWDDCGIARLSPRGGFEPA